MEEALVNRQGLLIRAVPNSKGSTFEPKDEDDIFNKTVFPELASSTILVGNLNEIVGNPDDSVMPLTPLQEQRFLCAMGRNILVSAKRTQSGTSFASPTVSGVAALIKSAYPNFSLQEIGDVLLESAQTTFWVHPWGAVDLRGNVQTPHLIYNPDEFKESGLPPIVPPRVEVGNGYRLDLKVFPFSPKKFGRGVIEVRRALLYAELKKSHPDLTAEQLKPLFQKAVYDRQNQAASRIQTLWRQKKARKV